MKNIFKISKCGIAALLTLCILLGIAGISVHATAGAEETTAVTEEAKVATEDNTVSTEETTQELMPTMARGCTDYDTFHDLLDAQLIGYEGKANHTKLETGYSYEYTKSGSYWSIYLEGPNGPIGTFRVGSMI